MTRNMSHEKHAFPTEMETKQWLRLQLHIFTFVIKLINIKVW